MADTEDIFGEVIYAYTRADAIADGTLIDVSDTAREAGIVYPVAVTHAVWYGIIEPDQKAIEHGESVSGRLWDALYMLYIKIKVSKSAGQRVDYQLIATHAGHHNLHNLKALCHGGDNGEPVITIMLPSED